MLKLLEFKRFIAKILQKFYFYILQFCECVTSSSWQKVELVM